MTSHSPPVALAIHLALLSCISFGGFPSVLPDLRNFVVATNGWVTDREFTDFFALAQAVPGPNMILLTSFIGWKVGGVPGAIVSAVATFGPACAMYFAAYHLWDRFRDAPWQKIVRRGLAPLTIGLVIAGGAVMARTGDARWQGAALTIAAAGLMIRTRINPLWLIVGGGACGGLGFL
jgi:chromate transporter